MKKLVVVLILGIAAWKLFTNNFATTGNMAVTVPVDVVPQIERITNLVKPEKQFTCDGRKYCSDMNSREEAEFFNKNCPDTRMDGDHDGIPCENDSRF
jgi:hypothetical protein